ncbi:MAG: SusF/SusE family outer membrane protein [Candidatus Symbiothrix sp.]|nr:SusF/SusE family outer membrane protein [Candidatus Symbiothrix sp.]
MKSIYYSILFSISVLFLTGCEKEITPPERNQLKLTASSESLTLIEDDNDKQAISFSWNEATPIGSDYTFTYLFQLDVANNNFETATAPVTLTDEHSLGFTHAELYDLIVETWGKPAGESVELEARVAAKVNGPKFQYPEIAYSKTKVITYMPVSQPLYLIGTATDAGLNPANGIKMNELSNGRRYDWKGKLKAGNFKFISILGFMLPSYNRGASDNAVVERTSEEQPDDYFEIKDAGTYYISFSKKTMTITKKKASYDVLYLVGNACPAEWELNKLVSMNPDDKNPDLFVCQTSLKEGELKILTKADWNAPTFRPEVANASISNPKVMRTDGQDPDNKWKVSASEAGSYKIVLDVDKMTIQFTKL